MTGEYVLGVALAVGSGVFFQVGSLLQKKAVNDVSPEARKSGFMRALVKRPVWILGIICQFGLGAVAFVLAQKIIGPALVPGLTAAGFIVLAVGSVRMLGESLNRVEYLGIAVMIGGVFFLGISGLGIDIATVVALLRIPDVQLRIALFTAALTILWGGLLLASLKSRTRKGIIMALSGGFPYGIMNFWISLLIAVILTITGGRGTILEITVLIVAGVILAVTNVLGVWQMQVTFKYTQASNSVPVHGIAIQVSPIFVYFAVFSLRPGDAMSGVYIVVGALLVIISGFLLSRRKAAMEPV
jgi:drug/metabolite transporter (DMT)-like permease